MAKLNAAEAHQSRETHSVTADAMAAVRQYIKEADISRSEDPLEYWLKEKDAYPHLHLLPPCFFFVFFKGG